MEDTNAGASVLETYATKVFSKRIIGSISIIILAAAVFYKSPTESKLHKPHPLLTIRLYLPLQLILMTVILSYQMVSG